MMVSKVAVIALVAIVAVPIMLGYAMNLEQTTETEYELTDDKVNVTQLLQTGTAYTYTRADTYQLNTNYYRNNNPAQKLDPQYAYTDTTTTLKMQHNEYYQGFVPTLNNPLSRWAHFYLQFDYDFATSSHPNLQILNNNTTVLTTFNNITSVYFDIPDLKLYITYYNNTGTAVNDAVYQINGDPSTTYTKITYNPTGAQNYTGTGYLVFLYKTDPPFSGSELYADISAGYTFQLSPLAYAPFYKPVKPGLPQFTRSVLFTVDLSSVEDANTTFRIGQIIMTKTTTDDIVKWMVTNELGDVEPFEIYYDNSTTDNTYQIRIMADPLSGRSAGSGLSAYDISYDFRYVGAWPVIMGEANYYQNYTASTTTVQLGDLDINNQVALGSPSLVTPRIRIDDAEYRAFEYPIVYNQTYDPAAFKTNPSTKIDNITSYGTSIVFGGNQYNVKNGNITMGTHDIPVNGLVLSSVPDGSGQYQNKIGNTVISTTAAPSTITFNGQWSASISTTAQESYEVTKTEWKAGSFAWDGMDQNFLMIGLLTSLGAFIALGIYARQTRASIWPLLIVCGGAALLFFVML